MKKKKKKEIKNERTIFIVSSTLVHFPELINNLCMYLSLLCIHLFIQKLLFIYLFINHIPYLMFKQIDLAFIKLSTFTTKSSSISPYHFKLNRSIFFILEGSRKVCLFGYGRIFRNI